MKYEIFLVSLFLVPVALIGGCSQLSAVDSFEKCVNNGNPVLESYPRVCRTPDGKTFTEEGRISYEAAVQIARTSNCTAAGNLKQTHFYNNYTGTWWIDIDSQKEGCHPACVVTEATRTAEINWRCTGLIP
jgi:hypothetical protein